MKLFFSISLAVALLFSSCDRYEQKNNLPEQKKSADTLSEKSLVNDYNKFYFVGKTDKTSGIYKYNFENKKSKLVWSKRKEKVIDLWYSLDKSIIFFLTAKDLGIEGALPFVNRVKAYLINVETGTISYLKDIGSGLQVFTRWEGENFQIILYSFDKAVSSYINQNIFLFNTFGKLIMDELITYDLTKDGYPKPPKLLLQMVSPSKKFKLVNAEGDFNTLILKDIRTKKDHQVIKTTQQLYNVAWSGDSKLLFFSTVDISERNATLKTKNPESSQLIIYSTETKKIIKQWNGGGLKRFFIDAGLLFFDSGFSDDSAIYLYDYNSGEMESTIKIKGGCGIKSIPEILKVKK